MSVGASRLRAYLQVSLPMATPALLTVGYLVADGGLHRLRHARASSAATSRCCRCSSTTRSSARSATRPAMASTAQPGHGGDLHARAHGPAVRARPGRSYALSGHGARAEPRPLSRRATVVVPGVDGHRLPVVFMPHVVVDRACPSSTWTHGRAAPARDPRQLRGPRARGRSSPVLVSYALVRRLHPAALLVGALLAYVVVRKAFLVLAPGLNALVMLPYLIPGTVLADRPHRRLQPAAAAPSPGTWTILAMAYLIRKLPYAMKAAEAALYQVHPSLEEAAMSVGATPAPRACATSPRA